MEVFCNTAFYDNLRSLGVLFILYLAYIVNDSRSDSWLWKHAPECTHLLIGCCHQSLSTVLLVSTKENHRAIVFNNPTLAHDTMDTMDTMTHGCMSGVWCRGISQVR